MKTKIYIATILGPDIKSRQSVNDLLSHIENLHCKSVTVDFSNVKFVTRSFVDEYYNSVINNSLSDVKIETINIPEDIQILFDVIQHTQHKEKDVRLDATIVKCKTFSELQNVFKSLLL